MSWHENQQVLLSTACLGNSTRRPPEHVLARTAACLGVNTGTQQHEAGLPSMSWHARQHVWASTPACLGTNSSMSWRQHQHVLARTPACVFGVNTSMSTPACQHQHVNTSMSSLARTPACLGVNTSMSRPPQHVLARQHVLASTPACLANITRRLPQHVLACLGNSTRRPPQLVLARTPACLGVNTACLGNSIRRLPQHVCTNTSMPWSQHQHVLATAPGGLPSMSRRQVASTPACLGNFARRPPQHVVVERTPSCMFLQQHQAASPSCVHQAASPACLGTNTSMSWHQHQNVLATARQPSQHVFAQFLACLGINTSMSRQQHQHFLARITACLGINTRMSWHQHQHVLATAPGALPSMRQDKHVLA